jgi:hypothetical protein
MATLQIPKPPSQKPKGVDFETKLAGPPQPTAPSSDEPPLPLGWTKMESRKFPGMFYYIGPNGPQWDHPTATQSQRRLAREKLASIYQVDYKKWESIETFNPPTLNEGTKASASYARHPVAKKDPDHFVSLKQKDFQAFPVSRAGHTLSWPAHIVPPFESNSTYRSDFRPSSARRPQRTRNLTPPRQLRFDHNSTNRTDFVDHHPKRPHLVHPVPQLHFRHGTKINSTNRTDFVDFGAYTLARSRRPRFFRDPGWVKNHQQGTPSSRLPEAAEIEDPLAGEVGVVPMNRMIPVVDGRLPGDFNSTYQTDFVETEKVVPNTVRRNSRELDRLVRSRVKAHEELRGFE